MSIRGHRVPVKNRDRAIAFYSALLGADLKQQADVLTFEERNEDVPTLLHLTVSRRLDDALAFVWSNGGCILQPEIDVDRNGCVLVQDCEGNHIALRTTEA